MITGHNIVILSTQDWDALPTRKHHWARRFARQGNQVLYIEQQMHWLGWLVDLRRQLGRAVRWTAGPRQVEERLWVYTLPIVLPFFQMIGFINWLNNRLLLPLLLGVMRRLGFDNVLLFAYTPHCGGLIGRLHERLSVYECVDEFAAVRGLVYAPTLAALEREVLAAAGLTIVTHAHLLARRQALAQRICVVPNGADLDHFAAAGEPAMPVAAAVAALPRPVVGFHGWIQYWVDFDLIAHAARCHPEWSFALVGPVEPLARVDKVRGLSNVHFLGRHSYQDMPSVVAGFDVCINPFVLNELADAVSPIKLYEYLASGKPVVSVDMPAAQEFCELIPLTRTPAQFVAALEQLLAPSAKGNSAARAAARKQAVAGYSWLARFAQMEAQVEPLLAAGQPA